MMKVVIRIMETNKAGSSGRKDMSDHTWYQQPAFGISHMASLASSTRGCEPTPLLPA
jgi:hypothetical protein